MLKPKISDLLKSKLLSSRLVDIYSLLDKNIQIDDLQPVFKNLLQSKSFLKNIGIDLPFWFGDFNSTNKTMVVALDPKRNRQEHNEISVNTIFSVHTEEGKNTNRNDYWSFVSFLAKTGFIYLTDIYKIYYETRDKNGNVLLSNKDKSFITGDCYEQNKSILQKEIEIVKPQRIITLGLGAANAVKRIKGVVTDQINFKNENEELEYIFLPHISRTVTQSIRTIGNLYKGLGIITQREEIELIGSSILKHSSLREILSEN